MPDFVHLHLHSEYSLLDSTLRVADIPAAALAAGQDAVALTDSGALYGAVAFSRACAEAGVRPVIGCEIFYTEGSRTARSRETLYRLVLLCENNEGYLNLCRIVSASFTEGWYGVPRVDRDLLERNRGGLICLSGGIDGPVAAALCAGDAETAERRASGLLSLFGSDNFFIELTNHGGREERQILPELYALSEKLGVSCAAANDVRYRSPGDAAVHSVLRCISAGRPLSSSDPTGGEYWFKSGADMEKLFAGFPGAVANTARIAARCSVDFGDGSLHLPSFPLPDGVCADDELRRLTFEGLGRLRAGGRIPAAGRTADEYAERAEYELSVIRGMGYGDYFLIVADYVGFAKRSGISVGPGRGSGCGSLVAFATGITDIDPLLYGLYFERFLNPERVSMPDIDVDFDYNRRGEVVDYVIGRYGRDRVCQIISFGTLAARAAVRDAARVLGTDPYETDRVCSLIPREPDVTLASALEKPALKELYGCQPSVKRLIDTASAIEGLPRNVSVHPAGVVITSGPVADRVPLALSGDTVVTQYDMATVEKLGLLKFDLLALRNLTVIDDACAEIRRTEPDFDIAKVDENDPATYAMLSSGGTSGVFQLDKEGMTRLITRLRPRSVQDIMTALALYRPGPMDSIPRYLECRRDPSSVTYPHPLLKPVLESTYGCLIYQEQVMSVFRIMAGYSLGRADLIRRAMSKKKAEALEAERGAFVEGARERGMSAAAAGRLFDDMSSFAGYAFNKSHAAAYAVITFRTAWLKANRPAAFFAALLNSVAGMPEKVAEYVAEAEKHGVKVEGPDVNRSAEGFSVSGGSILFGLSAIRSAGAGTAAAAVEARKEAPFSSLRDFLTRMPQKDVSRRVAEAYIRSGALDCTGATRTSMLAMLDGSLASLSERSRSNPEGQMDIFSSSDPAGNGDDTPPDLREFGASELRRMEAEYTGVAFTLVSSASAQVASAAPPAGRASAPGAGPAAAGKEGAAGDAPSSPDSPAPGRGPAPAVEPPGMIFIRVPSADSEVFRKCDNLCAIFDGPVPVTYYYSDAGRYAAREGGVAFSEFLIGELRREAGQDSVVTRSRHRRDS
jgi:DNA polymerase-3 subunit alpha